MTDDELTQLNLATAAIRASWAPERSRSPLAELEAFCGLWCGQTHKLAAWTKLTSARRGASPDPAIVSARRAAHQLLVDHLQALRDCGKIDKHVDLPDLAAMTLIELEQILRMDLVAPVSTLDPRYREMRVRLAKELEPTFGDGSPKASQPRRRTRDVHTLRPPHRRIRR